MNNKNTMNHTRFELTKKLLIPQSKNKEKQTHRSSFVKEFLQGDRNNDDNSTNTSNSPRWSLIELPRGAITAGCSCPRFPQQQTQTQIINQQHFSASKHKPKCKKTQMNEEIKKMCQMGRTQTAMERISISKNRAKYI